MRRNSTASPTPAVGTCSLLVIFAVLVLVTLALLSLADVRSTARLSEKSRDAIVAYYEADGQAEEILAALRRGEDVPDVARDGDVYSFCCTVADTQSLEAEVEISEGSYRILRWQVVSTAEWEDEDDLVVWDGLPE